jgi:DNA repair exonuclease SbcCD ATPase subunit
LGAENQTLKNEILSARAEYSQKLHLLQRAGEKAEVDHAERSLKDMKTIADLERKIMEHDMSTRELKIELSGLRAQMAKSEKFPEKISQLQSQLLDMDDKRAALEGRVQECLAEIEALSKINENLMKKLKDLSGSDDRRDFADTFEEVMRDEMMAMKVAFEAKLRIAKAETEAVSRRNQMEILKMQSPHALGMV